MLFWLLQNEDPILKTYYLFALQTGGDFKEYVSCGQQRLKIRISCSEWRTVSPNDPYVVLYISNPSDFKDRLMLRFYPEKIALAVDHRAAVMKTLGLKGATREKKRFVFASYEAFRQSPFVRILAWVSEQIDELTIPATKPPSGGAVSTLVHISEQFMEQNFAKLAANREF